jgi:hypothetical protein
LKYNLTLTRSNELDIIVTDLLDHLFSLIPTSVSKNWIKFTQYFELWKGFAEQGQVQFDYMIKKSNKKHTIGSKYANPNFAPLLKTVSILVDRLMKTCP